MLTLLNLNIGLFKKNIYIKKSKHTRIIDKTKYRNKMLERYVRHQ